MRTTRQSQRQRDHSSGDHNSENQRSPAAGSHNDEGSLTAVSKEAVHRLLKRASSRKAPGAKGRKEPQTSEPEAKNTETESMIQKGKRKVKEEPSRDFSLKRCTNRNVERSTSSRVKDEETSAHYDTNEYEWEEGTIPIPEYSEGHSHDQERQVTIEFTESPSSAQRRPTRRASAEEKELAELVHKAHLLCLLARGRLIDKACNDRLIQASVLSLLPPYLLKIMEVPRLTTKILGSLVRWFHDNFQIRSQIIDKKSFKSSLKYALETREGTGEEITALSVALFRALNLTTRFVSILHVASLRPDADSCGSSNQAATRLDTRIFSSTTNVTSPNQFYSQNPVQSTPDNTIEGMAHESLRRGKHHNRESNSTCKKNLLKDLTETARSDDNASASKLWSDKEPKRRGDVEFELQLGMALSATATGVHDKFTAHGSLSYGSFKKMRSNKIEESPVSALGSSSAVWSRKAGPPSFWAEVYCSGESLTGRWVHVDSANAIIDGEDKVEVAAAACKRPLKYVVAFAGNGAKDVTRRYCMQWYKIASQRVSSLWWDTVLAPLKQLESDATGSMVQLDVFEGNPELEKKASEATDPLEMDCRPSIGASSTECRGDVNLSQASKQVNKATDMEPEPQLSVNPCRNNLEDMELETRALTEPLPTNQLAYKSHHLYAIERWLTKNQILHPRGPVIGFCSGHPVYPRSCVKTLQSEHKWLREGLQVREKEHPAKVVRRCSKKPGNLQVFEPEEEEDTETTRELYGAWQVEPLNLPRAVNGVVPRNERGQVDVWSEKCLPPGTVHLRLPRLVPVVKRLEIDFAPAMVGFEFRNGRPFPLFEGIVVCSEFKDAIMEAYDEEEERREGEERKRNESQALIRWFQLLSSIVTRQRLEKSYMESTSNDQKKSQSRNACEAGIANAGFVEDSSRRLAWGSRSKEEEHEHVFPLEMQSLDEESLIMTKRCQCGFSIQVEEL